MSAHGAFRLGLLGEPQRHLFFTGKGGVGKTSLACATAIALADAGRSVLLVSTDPASNLDEMLGVPLGDSPRAVPGVPGLAAMNIDPEAAAEAYRRRVLEQMPAEAGEADRAAVREQLSGACTTEIAAFDEFAGLLAGDAPAVDHIVFDTAPTGHTLRLLSLPKAWSGFLEGNDRGASCLGPHSGLKMKEARFKAAVAALGDPALTRIVLVSRPDRAALAEAARTSGELAALGLGNQHLAVNGVFTASLASDAVARAVAAQGEAALSDMPEALAALPRDDVPLRPFDMIGLPALRALLSGEAPRAATPAVAHLPDLPSLSALVDALAGAGRGLVMVMGKGGVGKTTVAAALALGLLDRGHSVHLSTTDPAANLAATLAGEVDGLRVDRIDPRAETERYIGKIMATKGQGSRCGGTRPAARGPALTLHRGGRGLPCLLAHRRRSPQQLRGARYRADRPHAAPHGCDRRLPSPADARPGANRRGAIRNAADATAGSGLDQDRPGRSAGNHPRIGGGRVAGGPPAGPDRALRLGDQSQPRCHRNPGSASCGAHGGRGGTDRPGHRPPRPPHLSDTLRG